MQINSLEQILNLARNKTRQQIVVVWAVDSHTIESTASAVDMGIAEATLVGDKREILKVCNDKKIDPDKFTLVHQETEDASALAAVELINNKKGSLLMKGSLSTDKYMRAILDKEKGLMEPGAILSHVTVMKIPSYPKLLTFGDVAIIPLPGIKQKIAIANYLISTAKAIGVKTPKVSVLAATEQVLTGMPACTDAALLSKMAERNQIKGALIDGPLSLDLSINKEAVKIKGITSKVAGDADCILFPNIESGNVFYKTNIQCGNDEQAAILIGARVPAVLSSRGDSAKTKLYSIALAVMMAERSGNPA